jgi:N-acetylglucosamine-6-phosphate deacetylase
LRNPAKTQRALKAGKAQQGHEVSRVKTVLYARQLLTPVERFDDAVLVVEDGIIAAVGRRDSVIIPDSARALDFGDSVLAPGLIDIHVHGGAGHDVMEASNRGLATIERFLLRHGVTSYCPTTVTAPMWQTLRSLEFLGNAVERSQSHGGFDPGRARPVSIHLEGPFLSHARRGVHQATDLQPVSGSMFNQMWEAAGGRVGILTLAAELEGALALITEASRRGICVSLGHSNATLSQALAGIKAGARHATHTFNAMRGIDHRDPGLLGAILTSDEMTADIIADGRHVEPVIVDLFVRAKGLDRSVLISDGISATGMPDGVYRLGSIEVQVRDGRCEYDGRLAGSVLTLDRAVLNATRFAHLNFQDALRMVTLNPARVLRIDHRKGVLRAGADADIVVFSLAGEIRQVVLGGRFS